MQPDRMAKVLAGATTLAGGVWCGVLDAPDYLIGSDGRVASTVKRRLRVLRPIRCGKYLAVQMRLASGKLVKRYVHRLVLETCYGPPAPGQEARHLDGNPNNNDIANLAWGTRSENAADKEAHGTVARGERNPMAKLTRGAVDQMRAMYANGGWTYKRLGAEFGVSTMTALRAVKGEAWT